jgi:hypothetical protein
MTPMPATRRPMIIIPGRITNAMIPIYGFGVPDIVSRSIRKRTRPKLTAAMAAPTSVTGLLNDLGKKRFI